VPSLAGRAGGGGRGTVDAMIEVRELTKRYRSAIAVDGLSFTVRPGRVTGFLGPNGAGKSTTLRLILGLDAPTSGTATVDLPFASPVAVPAHSSDKSGIRQRVIIRFCPP